MTAEAVAEATLRTLEHGRHEVSLSLNGRLIVLVNRLFPRLADRIAKRKVYNLFRDEIKYEKLAERPHRAPRRKCKIRFVVFPWLCRTAGRSFLEPLTKWRAGGRKPPDVLDSKKEFRPPLAKKPEPLIDSACYGPSTGNVSRANASQTT